MKTLEDRFVDARLDVQRGVGRLPAQPVETLERREFHRRARSLVVIAATVIAVVVGLAAITPAPLQETAGPGPDSTPEGSLETAPFSGEDWQLIVGEGANNDEGTSWKVCHRFAPSEGASEANGFGPSGCVNWPDDASGNVVIDAAFLTTPGGNDLLFVDLDNEPVDTVSVRINDGSQRDVAPFTMPGSGKQFAVVELPECFTGAWLQLARGEAVIDSRPLEAIGYTEPAEPFVPGEPSESDWIELAGGVSVALVPEQCGRSRIWTRSEMQAATSAPSIDLRLAFIPVTETGLAILIVGDRFLEEDQGFVGVELFGQPDQVKVHWEGLTETDTVAVDWDENGAFGVALVDKRDATILDVEPLNSD